MLNSNKTRELAYLAVVDDLAGAVGVHDGVVIGGAEVSSIDG